MSYNINYINNEIMKMTIINIIENNIEEKDYGHYNKNKITKTL